MWLLITVVLSQDIFKDTVDMHLLLVYSLFLYNFFVQFIRFDVPPDYNDDALFVLSNIFAEEINKPKRKEKAISPSVVRAFQQTEAKEEKKAKASTKKNQLQNQNSSCMAII